MCRTPLDIMICREIPPDPHDSSTLFRHQYEMITQSSTKQVKKSSKQSADKRTGSSSETDLISLSSTSQETNLETSLPAMGKHVFHEESKMYVPRLYLKEILLRLMCFRCRSCGEVWCFPLVTRNHSFARYSTPLLLSVN